MIIQLKHFGLRPHSSINMLIEKQLFRWAEVYALEKAKVNVERHYTLSPPYRIAVALVLPGPDEFIEARDHTLLAAARKVLKKLEQALKKRQSKSTLRLQTNLQLPAITRMRPFKNNRNKHN